MNKPDLSDLDIEVLIGQHFPFPVIREIQSEAIFKIVKSLVQEDKDYFILECPTGGGKSAIAYTVAKILKELFDVRSTICTSTLALQDQYLKDFPELGNLMGKMNYNCSRPGHKDLKYNDLICKDIQSLQLCLAKRDCPYIIARNNWQFECDARITNTHFMIEAGQQIYSGTEEKAFTPFMVLDEAHTLSDIMLSHCSFEIGPLDLTELFIQESENEHLILLFKRLKDFLYRTSTLAKKQDADFILLESTKLIELSFDINNLLDLIAEDLDEIKNDIRTSYEVDNNIQGRCSTLADYKRFYAKLRYPRYLNKCIEVISNLQSTYNVVSQFDPEEKLIAKASKENSIEICPVSSRSISEYTLLRKSNKFLFMSATICGFNDYVHELGLNPSKVAVLSMNSPFSIESRKINYIPVAKFSYANKEQALAEIIRYADNIIDIMHKYYGKPVRGLIHSGTYTNAQEFKERSKHRKNIETPKSILQATKFLDIKKEDLILASPTIYEGIDFKDDLARYQIIIKVPYDSLSDPLKKYTMKYNPNKYRKDAIIKLVQAYGRGTRHEEDYCITFILDENFGALLNATQLPNWVRNALTKLDKKEK